MAYLLGCQYCPRMVRLFKKSGSTAEFVGDYGLAAVFLLVKETV